MDKREQFRAMFGAEPTVAAKAPGRVNLIGEHIDYLGGSVLPIAIDRHIEVLARPVNSTRCEIWTSALGDQRAAFFDIADLSRRSTRKDAWLNYPIGVLAGYQDAGVEVPGFQAAIFSSLPVGAGLSSSAALETSFALILEQLTGSHQNVVDRAQLCQWAEHAYAQVPCGIMDQLAIGACEKDCALLIDCGLLTLRSVPIPTGVAVLTADTGVKHALGDGEYRKRREDCESAAKLLGVQSLRGVPVDGVTSNRLKLGDRLFRRARHAVTEMARVAAFATAMEEADFESLGQLMLAGHASLRDDFEVSCRELDVLVDAAYEFGPERGLIGSRMTGGGFGGSTVSLVREDAADDLKAHLEADFRQTFNRTPNCFITKAVGGATTVPLNQIPA